jgi:hypothetical protein
METETRIYSDAFKRKRCLHMLVVSWTFVFCETDGSETVFIESDEL